VKIQRYEKEDAKILTTGKSLPLLITPVRRKAGVDETPKDPDAKRLIFSKILIRIPFQLVGDLGRIKPKGLRKPL
jgi:hypothetical protein